MLTFQTPNCNLSGGTRAVADHTCFGGTLVLTAGLCCLGKPAGSCVVPRDAASCLTGSWETELRARGGKCCEATARRELSQDHGWGIM